MSAVIKRFVDRIVDASGKKPFTIMFAALVIMAASWFYASHLELKTDVLQLLPRDSPGFLAFEHQLGRTGGGATLLVIAESKERAANEKFVDDLSAKLNEIVEARKKCVAAQGPAAVPAVATPAATAAVAAAMSAKCGPMLISYLETGTKDVRKFFADNKWLYADIEDLLSADQTLDREIAKSLVKSGVITDLEGDDEKPAPPKTINAPNAPAPGGSAATPAPEPPAPKKSALGMDEFRDRWKSKANKHDDFPTGYFATPDGSQIGIRIVSTGTGMGDSGGDALLDKVTEVVAALDPPKYQKDMQIGFAGDIPNAIAEKRSIVSEAAFGTGIAFVLILGGIVVFFRSPWSLPVIALPSFIGIGCAYSFAMFTYGYVNTSGMFLGAIILGNGINYPIVLLSRYREFRARGQQPDEARKGAVWNAFRAELVGACVGSIAYGSLSITRFRGFSQFGMIGFVGMLLVWASMIPVVPAMIVIIERVQERLPTWLRDPPSKIDADGSRGAITKLIARATERAPWIFLVGAAVITLAACWKLPAYLRDPWEYNFDHLGSRGSKSGGGAGDWSNKAEKVFGGKMNIAGAMMLADTPDQVLALKKQILANDAKDPEGTLVAEVATVHDLMPGTEAEQKKKLEVLDRIRDRITPALLHEMDPEERKRVDEIRPPEDLHTLTAKDLPPLLRRRFEESNGAVGSLFYVRYGNHVSLSDGHNMLRIAKTTDNVVLPDGTVVQTASRSTIFAEMIRSMERDGPLASGASFLGVIVVVLIATASLRGSVAVLSVLLMGVVWTVGGAAIFGVQLNFLNFIALPITFGIGCEYPFNVFDRARLLKGEVSSALRRTGGAVALCSFTTTVGYSALLLNDNQALQSFGQLAMSGEIACLIGAMLVLPALLHVLPGWKAAMAKREAESGPAS